MGVANRASTGTDLSRSAPAEQAGAPRRRGRSSKITRAMISSAARAEFAERGYRGATTASIARRVGVTQPLVHYHFGSKEALWKAVVDELFDRLHAQLAAKRAELEDMGPAARLTGMCHAFVDFIVENPELSRLMNNDGVVAAPRLEWLVEEHLRPLCAAWEAELVEAKQLGLIKDIPVPFLSFIFLGAAQHFFDVAPLASELFGLEPRAPETAEAYANALVEVFLKGCGRAGDAG